MTEHGFPGEGRPSYHYRSSWALGEGAHEASAPKIVWEEVACHFEEIVWRELEQLGVFG